MKEKILSAIDNSIEYRINKLETSRNEKDRLIESEVISELISLRKKIANIYGDGE